MSRLTAKTDPADWKPGWCEEDCTDGDGRRLHERHWHSDQHPPGSPQEVRRLVLKTCPRGTACPENRDLGHSHLA